MCVLFECACGVERERVLRVRAQDALTECASSFKEELDSLRDEVELWRSRYVGAYGAGFLAGVDEMAGAWEQQCRWESSRRAHPAFFGRGGV